MFEKVNPSHPDKIADRIAGAIVDLAYKMSDNPKVAIEVLIGHDVCTIIAESSVKFLFSDIYDIVLRISNQRDIQVNYKRVPQDEHLADNQNEKILDEYLINVVNLFKSKCDKLICWYTLPHDDSYKKNHIHDLLNQNFNKNELIIKDLSCLYNNEYLNKCTFSKNFINDTANIYIFKELSKIIGEF